MESVEEAKLLLEYVRANPRMSFNKLANLVQREHPEFEDQSFDELVLRLARISWNYYYA